MLVGCVAGLCCGCVLMVWFGWCWIGVVWLCCELVSASGVFCCAERVKCVCVCVVPCNVDVLLVVWLLLVSC